ncbi:MAG TPA: hypothetical protein VHF69_06975, partial [Candidatus Synoicihabitans sp.]|nr:hypothetical protein [Candidatus Synoicihabitans sp.]
MDISVYQRTGRRKLYVSYIDPVSDQRIHRASAFAVDDPDGRRKARAWATTLARNDQRTPTNAERWSAWVPNWLERHYARAPRTLQRYLGAWKFLHHYLVDLADVQVPRALTYQHALAYHEWRVGQRKGSGRTVGNNTAILDLKVLQTIMSEAVRRDFAPSNPCLRLGLRKDPTRSARELSPEEISLVERSLPSFVAVDVAERGWMPIAYQIARYQGCRLRETSLDLRRQISLRENQITFYAKGRRGQKNVFETALHPQVRPLIERLIAEKRAVTCEIPLNASRLWRQFFDSIGMPDAWFHCLRATVATELARAGVN